MRKSIGLKVLPTFTFRGVWRQEQAKSEKFFIEDRLEMRDLSWQEQLFNE